MKWRDRIAQAFYLFAFLGLAKSHKDFFKWFNMRELGKNGQGTIPKAFQTT